MYQRSYISYIPYDLLKSYLNELSTYGKIDFFMMVEHFGENGGKNHIHVYVESSLKKVDSIVMSYVSYNENGPLKTSFSKKSDLSNWYWYVLHDKEYLLKKGLKKQFEYKLEDVYISDYTYFVDSVKDLRSMSEKNKYILECISSGESPISLYKRGVVSLYEMRLLDMYIKRF